MVGIITVRTSRENHKRKAIKAHIFGHWAAHQALLGESDEWSVSHVPSGYRVQSCPVPKETAIAIAEDLGKEIAFKTKSAVLGRGAHIREIWFRHAKVGRFD